MQLHNHSTKDNMNTVHADRAETTVRIAVFNGYEEEATNGVHNLDDGFEAPVFFGFFDFFVVFGVLH